MDSPQGPGRPSRDSLRIWVGQSTDLAELGRWRDALRAELPFENDKVTFDIDLRVQPLTYNLILGPFAHTEGQTVLSTLHAQGRTDAKILP